MKRMAVVNRAWMAASTSRHEDLAIADEAWLALRRKIVLADRLLREDLHRDSPVRALVLRVGFRSSITPLPLHHPYLWGGDPYAAILEIQSYGAAGNLEAVSNLGELLMAMVRSKTESPLWTAFLELKGTAQAPIVVAARRQSALEHLEPRFANLTDPPRLVSLSELGGLDERRTTIFFGPPSVYPSWVKLFPRSNTIWIRHAWNKELVFPEALMSMLSLAAPAATSRKFFSHQLSATASAVEPSNFGESDELATEMNRARLESELGKAAAEDDSAMIASRIGVLANDNYVLLPIEEGTMVTVFDPQERIVRREQTRRLLPGMFVVVRERGSRDHLRSLAETKFLKDPDATRASMRRWKTALQTSIRELGIDQVANSLRQLGVSVGHSSIKLWTTDFVHGPGTIEHFRAVLEYLDLSDTDSHWEHVLSVRRAGQEAGSYMRRQLVEQASRVRTDQIHRDSTLRFTLDGVDGGALVAVKLDEVLPEIVMAPVGLVGQMIEGV